MIYNAQHDTQRHLADSKDDGKLHLEGIESCDLVGG